MQSATTMIAPIDFEQDIQFGTPDIVAREATRYLFFAGDVLSPRRKQERKDLAGGGEEISSPCLWRSRYTIRRARITPLEYGARWDIVPRTPEGVRPIAVMNHGPNGMILEDSTLVGIPCYPGEEITPILRLGDEAMPMGVVELESIRAMNWSAFLQEGYQKLFFPTYPDLPVTLQELIGLIKSVKSVESVVKDLQLAMLESCDMFALWGTGRVESDNQLMRQPSTGGFAFGYSPLSETLLPQLEMPRQDQGLRTMAQLTGKITDAMLQQNQGADMEKIFALLKDNQESLVAGIVKALSAKPEADAPVIEVKPEPKPTKPTVK